MKKLTSRERRIALAAVKYVGMELSLMSKNGLYEFCAKYVEKTEKKK